MESFTVRSISTAGYFLAEMPGHKKTKYYCGCIDVCQRYKLRQDRTSMGLPPWIALDSDPKYPDQIINLKGYAWLS